MEYSIGEVSEIKDIPISTLRYYDRKGMFPGIKRGNGGIRYFSEEELDALEIIECLKKSGLSIQEITQFLNWCQEGDASLEKRCNFFHERLEAVNKQMADLQNTINTIKFKCWYYETALAAGKESAPHEVPDDELPAHVRQYRKRHSSKEN